MLRKGLFTLLAMSFLWGVSLHTTQAAFPDITGGAESSTPGDTYGSYSFYFSNEVEIEEGDKVQLDFGPEFALDPSNSYFDMYSYSGIIDYMYDQVVNTSDNTITYTIDLYDEPYGIDAFELYAYTITNPATAGTYPVTVRLLDSSDVEKDFGTIDVIIGQSLSYLDVSLSGVDNKTATAGGTYSFEFGPTSNIVSGEYVRIQFPQTADISAATITDLVYTDYSTPVSVTYDSLDVNTTNNTISFRITDPADSAGNYVTFSVENIVSPESYGPHAVRVDILDNTNTVREASVYQAAYLQSPADAANDRYDFIFMPTVPLASGDRVQVDFPPEFTLFPNGTEGYLNSRNSTFNTIENAVVDKDNGIISNEFSIYSSSNGLDSIRYSVSDYENPATNGIYTVVLTVLDSSDVVKETFTYDVVVGENFSYFYANTDNQTRIATGVTYTFEGQPRTPIEDGQKIILHFPETADLTSATISDVSYTNYTGSSTPSFTPGYAPNSLEFTVSSSAPSDGSIDIEVSGIKNPTQWGYQPVYIETRTATDDIIDVGANYITIDGPYTSDFNDVTMVTPVTGAADNILTFDTFYPYVDMEDGWDFILHFPATTDLSEVDPSDVTLTAGGFTSPAISIDNAEKTITITGDGTYDGNGMDLVISDVTNPTVGGSVSLYADIIYEGLLQETISENISFLSPSGIRQDSVNISTTKTSQLAEYEMTFDTPIAPQDGWFIEVDFEDTMDTTTYDFNDDFYFYQCCSLDTISASDVTHNTTTNTFTIELPYLYGNDSTDFNFRLSDLTNPSTPGDATFSVTLKDPLGNVAASTDFQYYVTDNMEVKPSSFQKAYTTDYRFSFTPDQDMADEDKVLIEFPEDFDISGAYSPYFSGTFDASAENFEVNTTENYLLFDVDTDFASIPTSDGNEVIIEVSGIKNPAMGSATAYDIKITHIYAGGSVVIVDGKPMRTTYPLLASASMDMSTLIAPASPVGPHQVLHGFVFFAPPATINPTVTLSNNVVSATSRYNIDFTPTTGLDSGWIIRVIFPSDTDISNVIESTANVRVSGGSMQSGSVSKNNATRTIDIDLSCSSCSGGSGTGLITVEIDGVENATTAGNYDLEVEIYDNSQAGRMAGDGAYTLVGAPANSAPDAPVDPYANTSANGATTGNASPTTLGSTSVVFTAEHSDPDGDSATHYEIEIYNSATLSIPNLVHSTNKTAFTTALADGSRSPAPGISTTATLTNGNTYYWRIRYFDDTNTPATPGAWSTTSSFTVDTSAPSVTRTPADAATNVPRSQVFEVEMSDSSSSVDISTVNIQIDGTNVVTGGVLNTVDFNFTSSPGADGATVTYEFTAVDPTMFSYGSTVNFVVQGSDTTGNAISGPNQTTSFTFANAPVVDNIPPVITANPANGATNVSRNHSFVVTATDGEADVDISTVNIDLDGVNVVTGGVLNTTDFNFTTVPAGDAPSVTYVFTAKDPTRFPYGKTVVFEAEATDSNSNTGSLSRTFTFANAPTTSGTGSGGGYTPEEPAEETKPSAGQDPETPVVENPETCAFFAEQVAGQNYEDINDTIMNNYASYLLDNGIILGRNPTEFGSKDAMTRSEVLRSIIQANCEKFSLEEVTKPPFPDVRTDHKDAVFIDAAKRAGIVSGYKEDGTYRPDRFISRSEAVKVVFQEVLGDIIPTFTGSRQPFVDVHEDAWYYEYISFGVQTGILKDTLTHEFFPNNAITREDIATLLVDTLRYRERLNTSEKPSAPEETTEPEEPELNLEDTVKDEDIVTEPIQACTYFEGRIGSPVYRDLVGNPQLADYADRLLEFGVVVGRNADTFAMFDEITRSEILRIMIQANCEEFTLKPVLSKPFPDVSVKHKDAVFIQAAKGAGVVSGYGDGTFKPDASISRAEILKILLEAALNKAFQRFDGALQNFTDIPEDAWYARYLRFVSTQNIMEGGVFSPEDMGTRVFIAETLLQILDFKESVVE